MGDSCREMLGGRAPGRVCDPRSLVREFGRRGLQTLLGKSLLPRLIHHGAGNFLADLGGALDLFAGDFAGLSLEKLAALSEIFSFSFSWGERCRDGSTN